MASKKISKIFAVLLVSLVIVLMAFNRTGRAYNPTISLSSTLNFPSINPDEAGDLTVSVTGAEDGNPVLIGAPNSVASSMVTISAWVSATNTVTVRVSNFGVTPVDPPSASFRVIVTKF